jgi:hypothetical protein
VSAANTYLYYPLIRIPEETLIYSLLYKDKIKRIIPRAHSVNEQDWEEFDRPNRIIRQALGYEFIEQADFYESREAISERFIGLVNDAIRTRHPQSFEYLFGKNFQERFKVTNRRIIHGTIYFLYPDKIDRNVFSLLRDIGWLRLDDAGRCEVEKELWHVYMTLLASNVSKLRGESVSTNFPLCENILRNKVFRDNFKNLLPEQYSAKTNLEELCITLIFNGQPNGDQRQKNIPLHEIINLQQAAYIRSGLEDKRIAFCQLIDNLTNKVISINPADKSGLLESYIKDVVDAATEFNNELRQAVTKELTSSKKQLKDYWQAGISISFPIIGAIVDQFLSQGLQPYYGKLSGSLAALVSFLMLRQKPNSPLLQTNRVAYSSRQTAYLYLNRLWEIKRSKMKSLDLIND